MHGCAACDCVYLLSDPGLAILAEEEGLTFDRGGGMRALGVDGFETDGVDPTEEEALVAAACSAFARSRRGFMRKYCPMPIKLDTIQ